MFKREDIRVEIRASVRWGEGLMRRVNFSKETNKKRTTLKKGGGGDKEKGGG